MRDMHPDILELLARRATEGLNDEDAERLSMLLTEHQVDDSEAFDLAAAAAANAFALEHERSSEEVPAGLKARLRDDADRFFAPEQSNVVALRPASNWRRSAGLGWATAAALALALIMTNLADDTTAPDYESQRQQLVAAAESTVVIPWATPDFAEYANVEGDVVWNDERQEGYLLLSGMPANDPGVSQYQLWIVDPERDGNPVDGGVFDIPRGATEVVVPIDAKLAVNNPKVFAITREQPGGVVVSQGPLLVVASAG